MPRARKPKVQLTPDQKRQQRKIRAQLRKERAQSSTKVSTGPVASKDDTVISVRTDDSPVVPEHREEQFWVSTRDRMAAMKIMNDHRERPFWMSLPLERGTPPTSGYFPCSMFSREGRWYFGFLFRQHRDKFFEKTRNQGARKELTA